ncbi:SET domain-containing protein [Paraburkholderia sp. GAS42]|jgi:SET domain-containing protein|uniref:SET domain-containing protein n=1 Tax=Paraburkholderia sp. GAS42 TaxID=3035135 RepID=UPI003D25AB1B
MKKRGVIGHTFHFALSDDRVIDGSRGGNSARWLNHACGANCEAVEDAGRIFIEATSSIDVGEELFIDYQLAIDEPLTESVRNRYVCHCGAITCRRSMLASVA